MSQKTPVENNGIKAKPVEELQTISKCDELTKAIREDNLKFLSDKQVFDAGYFGFVWQLCESHSIDAAKLTASFLLETYVHSREKPNLLQWVELLNKQLNDKAEANEWFIAHLTEPGNGLRLLVKLFFKCPNSTVRQMFQRLLLNSLLRIEQKHVVAKFIKFLLDLIAFKEKFNVRFMSEYFSFLCEFARTGSHESLVLVRAGAIPKCARFYLANRRAQPKKKYQYHFIS